MIRIINQYKYTEVELKTLLKSVVIITDTREKENLHILNWFDENEIKHERQKLNTGDYSFYLPKNEEHGIIKDIYYTDHISIERKNSVDELIGNFASDRERIENEFLRHRGKLILVIEDNGYGDIISGNYISKYNSKAVIGTLHSFSMRYDIPFIFINKADVGCFIYCTFYYFLRNIIN